MQESAYKKAVTRLNLLRGHVNRANVVDQELKKASFDQDELRYHLWKYIPEKYFECHESFSKTHGGKPTEIETRPEYAFKNYRWEDPSFDYHERYEGAEYANQVLYTYVNQLFHDKIFTPENIANNMDEFIVSSASSCMVISPVSMVKIMGHYGLY